MFSSEILGCLCLSAISILQAVRVNAEVYKCPKIVKRAQWGARAPKHESPLSGKPTTVLIKSGGVNCLSRAQCQKAVRNLQFSNLHIDKLDDITCSFAIGSDGLVYEGRGWKKTVVGNKALVLCVLGIFLETSPAPLQIQTLMNFLRCQGTQSMLDSSYKIVTPRDISPASSSNPHTNLYKIIQWLPHYSGPSPAPTTTTTATSPATSTPETAKHSKTTANE